MLGRERAVLKSGLVHLFEAKAYVLAPASILVLICSCSVSALTGKDVPRGASTFFKYVQATSAAISPNSAWVRLSVSLFSPTFRRS